MKYRSKSYRWNRIKGSDGKNPLELADLDTINIDWVMFSKYEILF